MPRQTRDGTERNEAVIKRLMPVVSFVTVICILSETKKKKQKILFVVQPPLSSFYIFAWWGGWWDGFLSRRAVGRSDVQQQQHRSWLFFFFSHPIFTSSSSSSYFILFHFLFWRKSNKITATAVRTYGYARRIFRVTDYLTTISLLARLDWPLKSRTSVCLLPPPQPLVKIASLYWSNVKEWRG